MTLSAVLIVGMVGVIVGGIWIKMKGKYKCTIVTLCGGFLLALIGFIFAIDSNSVVLLVISGSSLGIFLAPSLTIGIELACEVGFPVGESYSNGLI